MRRGRQNFELKLFGCKLYHTSAKFTFGGGEKYLGVQKAPRAPKTYKGRKKLIRKTKKSGDLFFVFFFVLCKGEW